MRNELLSTLLGLGGDAMIAVGRLGREIERLSRIGHVVVVEVDERTDEIVGPTIADRPWQRRVFRRPRTRVVVEILDDVDLASPTRAEIVRGMPDDVLTARALRLRDELVELDAEMERRAAMRKDDGL